MKTTTINEESNTFYSHGDHLGSTRIVTDETKNIIAAISYHPFGEPCIEEGSEAYLFTGKKRDATGLYYYGARYYDCELGRFLTRDPLKGELLNPQSLNRYSYCRNNPLLYIDPDGKMEKKFSREGSEYPGAPSEYLYFFGKIGHLTYVNLYICYEPDGSDILVSGLIVFEVQKTSYAEDRLEWSDPVCFDIALGGGIILNPEEVKVSVIAEDGVSLTTIGIDLFEDHVTVNINRESGEVGDMIYIYFYFRTTASGEKELVIVVSHSHLDCPLPFDEPFDRSTETTVPLSQPEVI